MGKLLKYSIITVVVLVALYGSVNISPLDEVKLAQKSAIFDPRAYAEAFMKNEVSTIPAVDVLDFIQNISKNTSGYCELKGKKLGISDEYNFIIEGKGAVTSIEAEYVVLNLDNNNKLFLATDFIFGNAIRDGSAMADIGDYQNTMDFNSISVELNNLVRETIVPSFKERVQLDDIVSFKGAVKVDVTNPNLNSLKVIPLSINYND